MAAQAHDADVAVHVGTLGDVPTLTSMGKRLHADSTYRDLSFDAKKVGEIFSHLVNDPSGVVFVATEESRIVGAFGGIVVPTWFGRDLMGVDFAFFVDPAARNDMTAPTLLLAFESWCKRRGARHIRLGSAIGIDVDSTARLYQSLGFERSFPSFTKEVGNATH